MSGIDRRGAWLLIALGGLLCGMAWRLNVVWLVWWAVMIELVGLSLLFMRNKTAVWILDRFGDIFNAIWP